jgi:hypothetical protein
MILLNFLLFKKCPRGYRSSNSGICETCQNNAQIYDYMYLGFIYLLTLMFNFIFIDQSFIKSSEYKSPFSLKKLKYVNKWLDFSLKFIF